MIFAREATPIPDYPLPYYVDDAGEYVFPPRLLTSLIDNAVTRWPERPAIDYFGRCWTYAELGELVDKAARGLQDRGFGKGDRLGLCLGNSPYHVVLYFAVLKVGGIVVNLNPLYTEYELDHLFRDAGMKIVAVPEVRFVHEKVEHAARKAGVEKVLVCRMKDMLPFAKNIGFRLFRRADHIQISDPEITLEMADLIANGGKPDPVQMDPDDVAVLQYTGGTTGIPKGAMLTHASLAANCGQMLAHFGGMVEEQQRTLGVLPMFHVFALTSVLNFAIEMGGELVLLPRFEMKQVLATIKRKPPTQVYGVPTIWSAFNNLPKGQMPDLSSVQCCISGGAPLPLEVRQAFEERSGTRVVEGYGLSEASPIITCNPLFGQVKNNSAGPRFPGTTIEIRDPENPEHLCKQGERGEVMARGPQLMKGYWNNPEATEKTFYKGALRTADIGYLDEDGYLFLVDRIKDLILCSGYNVYPRVIEDAAYQHPDVKEAIAIGIPDEYRGQAPKLFVAISGDSDLTPEALEEFLKIRLNKIEMPEEIEFRDSLPKTMVGKLSKKELVEEEEAKRNG
ncbi:long-chain fatty acid--CoA ligase [Alteraurantiacibacter aquimixticola]|uniref:Long-chain fatty acid--CoA ligase n=2 Tax=Alteraurantiacibacter aquimixticola TaxID=2489173 RepID=A0A4T3F3Q8_9SPHN|nr:long-chain fatty acid--CoA ligase [Alteraurantiacibacter aquimixticola]